MTVDPTELKQSYILVVSDEGATKIVGFGPGGAETVPALENARFRNEILSLPEIATLRNKHKLFFFAEYDAAEKFMLKKLEDGQIPSAMFLDVEVRSKTNGGEYSYKLLSTLQERGAIVSPEKSGISVYVMSSNWQDFLYKLDPTPMRLIKLAEKRDLNMDNPKPLINRLLGEGTWLETQNTDLSGTNRRIPLLANDDIWVPNLRSSMRHFDRFVRLYEGPQVLFEGIKTMVEKGRIIPSIHIDGVKNTADFLKKFESPEGQAVIAQYAAYMKERREPVQHFGTHERPTNIPAIYTYDNRFFVPDSCDIGGQNPLGEDMDDDRFLPPDRWNIGREKLSAEEIVQHFGCDGKNWLVLPIRGGDTTSLRGEVQAIWINKIKLPTNLEALHEEADGQDHCR